MKTSKSLQLLDTQNNNISPIVGIESLFYETYVSNNNVNTIHRNSLYDKLLMDVSSYKLNYQSDGTLSGGDATTVIMNLETKNVGNDKISGSGTKIVPDTKGLKYSYATVNDFASFIGKNSSLATALVDNATFANSLTYTEEQKSMFGVIPSNYCFLLGTLKLGAKRINISTYLPAIDYGKGHKQGDNYYELFVSYPYMTGLGPKYESYQILPYAGSSFSNLDGSVLMIDKNLSSSDPKYLKWGTANAHQHTINQMPGYNSGINYKNLIFTSLDYIGGTPGTSDESQAYLMISDKDNLTNGIKSLAIPNIYSSISSTSNSSVITLNGIHLNTQKETLTYLGSFTNKITINNVAHASVADKSDWWNSENQIRSDVTPEEGVTFLTYNSDGNGSFKWAKPVASSGSNTYNISGATSLHNSSTDVYTDLLTNNINNTNTSCFVIDGISKIYNKVDSGTSAQLDGSVHFIDIAATTWGMALAKSIDISIGLKTTISSPTELSTNDEIVTGLRLYNGETEVITAQQTFNKIGFTTKTISDSFFKSGYVGNCITEFNSTSAPAFYLVGTITKGTNDSSVDKSYIPKYAIKISEQTSTPNPRIDLGASISATTTDGEGKADVYANSYYASSDETLKKNIERIEDSDVIPDIYAFDWADNNQHSYGFIAQRLEEQGYPELVSESRIKSVNYNAALALTVGKLRAKVEKQDAIIAALQKEIQNIKMIIQSK